MVNISESLLLVRFNENPLAFCLILDVTTVMLSRLMSRFMESMTAESDTTPLFSLATAQTSIENGNSVVRNKMMFFISKYLFSPCTQNCRICVGVLSAAQWLYFTFNSIKLLLKSCHNMYLPVNQRDNHISYFCMCLNI